MENKTVVNMETVIEYIEKHLDGRLDLEMVAEAVHYSKYHLHRMFTGTIDYAHNHTAGENGDFHAGACFRPYEFVGSVWVCYFQPDIIRKEFNLPANLEPVNILVIGYSNDADADTNRFGSDRIPMSQLVSYENL